MREEQVRGGTDLSSTTFIVGSRETRTAYGLPSRGCIDTRNEDSTTGEDYGCAYLCPFNGVRMCRMELDGAAHGSRRENCAANNCSQLPQDPSISLLRPLPATHRLPSLDPLSCLCCKLESFILSHDPSIRYKLFFIFLQNRVKSRRRPLDLRISAPQMHTSYIILLSTCELRSAFLDSLSWR